MQLALATKGPFLSKSIYSTGNSAPSVGERGESLVETMKAERPPDVADAGEKGTSAASDTNDSKNSPIQVNVSNLKATATATVGPEGSFSFSFTFLPLNSTVVE